MSRNHDRQACRTTGTRSNPYDGAIRRRFRTAFEDTVAWLLTHTVANVVATMLRIVWCSVTAILTRVVARQAQGVDRLAGLTDRDRR